ncbi:hypothetical protein EDC94DRAFT_626740 [Helicostylum pulchrum]|nr:hypothetical protein EDC94DRAFT_626740 [Helicostylum pulchrum]
MYIFTKLIHAFYMFVCVRIYMVYRIEITWFSSTHVVIYQVLMHSFFFFMCMQLKKYL